MFRLTKAICRVIVEEIKPHLKESLRITSISPEAKILCALRFFATGTNLINMRVLCMLFYLIPIVFIGSYQSSVGQDMFLAMSQPSVSRCVREVANALIRLAGERIRFSNHAERAATKLK